MGLSRAMVSFTAVTAVALGMLCSPAIARPLDKVLASGGITVFVYADYPPYSWREGGRMRGIDVLIAEEIAKVLDVRLDLLVRQADESVDDDLRVNVWKGDVIEHKAADVMLHVPFDRALETRAESLAILYNAYFREEIALVVDRAEVPEVQSFAPLVHRPIAVEVDTASDFFLSNLFGGRLQNSIRRGRTFLDAADFYRNGETNALMASRAQAEWVAATASSRDNYVAQPPMQGIVRASWPIGMAVKHDSRDLGYALGDVIDGLVESGRMEEIFESFGVTYLPPALY